MILEQLLAAIQANTQATQALAQAMASGGTMAGTAVLNGPVNTVVTQPANAAQTGLGMGLDAAPPPQNVTSEQILSLIQPHIGNDAIKAELGTAMRGMGINALPEAQPHQYGALYQAFQRVIGKFTGGGQAQPQTTSII